MSYMSVFVLTSLLLFLLLGLGVGKFFFDNRRSIRELNILKKKYEQIELDFKQKNYRKISFDELGYKRLEEITTNALEKDIKHHSFKKVTVIMWHQKKYLLHLYDELSVVSLIIFIITIIMAFYSGLENVTDVQNQLSGWKYITSFINNISKTPFEIMPLIEVVTLVIIIVKIMANISIIKDLITYD